MKTLVLVAALIASPIFAQADSSRAQTTELLAALTRNAKEIKYGVGIHGADPLIDKQDISALLASQSADLSTAESGTIQISDVRSSCRDVTEGRLGAQSQECLLVFTHTEHKVTSKGFMTMKNPARSTITLNFKTSKVVRPGSELKIVDNTVKVNLMATMGGGN